MLREEIQRCLALLGDLLNEPVEITVAGGAALILAHGLDRPTMDIDAVFTAPPFDDGVRAAIAAVAAEQELPHGWLNDAAKGFVEVLGDDFLGRRIRLGRWGRLTVYALGRRDLILMKLYAMRPEDVEDLEGLSPTGEEVDYVRQELGRIHRLNPGAALNISLYLEQGGAA